MADDAPWLKYQAPSDGPWTKYASPSGAGLFDDLIPQSAPPGGTGLFDDLIPKKQPSTLGDIARSGLAGVERGAIGIAGGLGDLRELAGNAAEKLGLPRGVGEAIAASLPVSGALTKFAPTSANITQKVESNLSPIYQPQTTPGKYAESVGEFLPAAAIPGGEASLGGRLLKMVALPGVASEAAGEPTAGTPIEPVARTAAAITAGGLGALKKGAAPAEIPSAATIKTAAGKAYDVLQYAGNGIPVPPKAWNSLNNRAIDLLNTKGLREPIVPKTHAIANDVFGHPQVGDVNDLVVAKRAFKELSNGSDASEAKAANALLPMIDTQIIQAAPQLYRQLRTADADYASAMQAKQVEDAVELGKLNAGTSGVGGNLVNTIRQQFKPMVKPGDEMPGLTPDELAQARKVATGGSRASLTNLLRLGGRLDPSSGGLMAALQLGATLPTGGANIPVAIGGYAARKLAEARTLSDANKLSEMIRSRSPFAAATQTTALPSASSLAPFQRALLGAVLARSSASDQNRSLLSPPLYTPRPTSSPAAANPNAVARAVLSAVLARQANQQRQPAPTF